MQCCDHHLWNLNSEEDSHNQDQHHGYAQGVLSDNPLVVNIATKIFTGQNNRYIKSGLIFCFNYLPLLLHCFGLRRSLRFSALISPKKSKELKTTNDMHGNR
jgi:hypothetical protein